MMNPLDLNTLRVKRLTVDPELLVQWANVDFAANNTLRLPKPLGLPDGCRCQSVYFHPANRCFEILVQHDSFEMVALGDTPPKMEARYGFYDVVKIEASPSKTQLWASLVAEAATSALALAHSIEKAGACEELTACADVCATLRGTLGKLMASMQSQPEVKAANTAAMKGTGAA